MLPSSVTPWTAFHQAPPSMGSSRQEHWRALPSASAGDLPDPGTGPTAPALAGEVFTVSHQEALWIEYGSTEEVSDLLKFTL